MPRGVYKHKPNQVEHTVDDTTLIFVVQKDGSKHTIIVDTKDYDDFHLGDHRLWVIKNTNTVYGCIRVKGKNTSLHNLLLGPSPKGEEPDHADRNGLNNTRDNLHFLPKSKNCANRSRRKDNKSGFIGVSIYRYKDITILYRGQLITTLNGSQHYYNIGYFKTAEEAAKARDRKVLEMYGDSANLNFPQLKQQYQEEIDNAVV